MNKKSTLQEIKERSKAAISKKKTPAQKRQDKIDKLQSNPSSWKFLEDKIHEDVSSLNKSFIKFRSIYQSGRRFSAKEWIQIMAALLDEVD